jgi:hypothetical protein
MRGTCLRRSVVGVENDVSRRAGEGPSCETNLVVTGTKDELGIGVQV